MEPWILLVAVLVCPVVMGTAMLLMWREMRRGGHGPEKHRESDSPVASKPDEANARRA
jgi:hypothetical protein